MKSQYEIFLDTDVFLDYLFGQDILKSSLLLKCLMMFDGCYTSVINAAEIFSGCTDKRMLGNAKHSFYGVGVLGIPYRYSFSISEVIEQIKKKI